MSHKAVELFPSWYSKGVNKEVTDSELNLRRTAITEILKIDDKAVWIKILRVYASIDRLNSDAYTEVVDLVRNGDVNFLIENENLVRVISGCAIAQKIEQNNTWISDLLALSLMSLEFNPHFSPPILELQKVAKEFWLTECEEKRKINTDFKIANFTLKPNNHPQLSTLSAEVAALHAHADSLGKAVVASQNEIDNLYKEVNVINATLVEIKKNFVALSEETNVLWWLFGAYSSITGRLFSKHTADQLSIIIAIELGKLTGELPGIGGLESILHKALSNVEYEPGQVVGIATIIESMKDFQQKLKVELPSDHPGLEPLTPLLFSLRSFCEHASTEWKSVFGKVVHLDLSHKINHAHCSFQLYKEIMLISVFETL